MVLAYISTGKNSAQYDMAIALIKIFNIIENIKDIIINHNI